ncbi:MAG: hypothetical protein JKY50_09030 [Oleispira sp.]|nr:hypothetical protein [Oleispira sp.]MBL4880943.1 hypothetical protein [Oleispira sp.]
MEENKTVMKARLNQPIVGCSLDIDDLKKLSKILQERSNTALKYELEKLDRLKGDVSNKEAAKKDAEEAFILRYSIKGDKGQELFGLFDEVFSSPNYPDKVVSFYVNSANTLKARYNYTPQNSFTVHLDFSKPKIFDLSIFPSHPTPNDSFFEVEGYDVSWVNGVYSEIDQFLKERMQPLGVVHKHSIYDLLLWVVGYPIAFWGCYKASNMVESIFGDFSSFLKNALYLYVGLFCLVSFRVLYHYARWVFPKIEYKSSLNKNLKHQLFLGALSLSVISVFIVDIIRSVF